MAWFLNRRANVRSIATPQGAVPRSAASLMHRRGWKQIKAGVFAGPYATRHGTWDGEIEDAGDTLRVFICDPPACMQSHPKWICFNKHDDHGWYRIHLAVSPVDGDPNAVIRYVEQLITESFKL